VTLPVSEQPTKERLESHRSHVRSVIAASAPRGEAREGHRAPTTPEEEVAFREWYRAMFAAGLSGAGWPVEWGGRHDHHPLFDVITLEELIRERGPRPLDQVNLTSGVLLTFGSDAQKARYLPRIRSAEDIWCQLFSEPGAGSDLAGIRTHARERPDGTVVLTGQKTWTTDGHWAQMGLALARTSDGPSRHAAFTAVAVPMSATGIEVRPLITIGGAHALNETFLDDVVLSPDAVLRGVGKSWSVAMSGLELERFGVGGTVAHLGVLTEDLVRLARSLRIGVGTALEEDDTQQAISDLDAETEAATAFVDRHIELMLTGQHDEGGAAMAKLLTTETYGRIAAYGVHVSTMGHLNDDPDAERSRVRLEDAWLCSRALIMSGGSSEIMRSILAKRRLGLPSANRR
jgi:alkylation response protein AidB-like acyl-CoA dehydrogenase